MSGAEPMQKVRKHSAIGIVALFLLSSFSLLLLSPSATATSGTDLAIVGSVEPVEDRWYTFSESIGFTVTVENMRSVTTGSNRQANWYVCSGDVGVVDCTSSPTDQGTFLLSNIPGDSMDNFTSTDFWYPGESADGIYTIVYQFAILDDVAANDLIKFNIFVSQTFSDVSANQNYNPFENIEHLAEYNGQRILNTNTDYSVQSRGTVISCLTCNLESEFGWQLWDSTETQMLKTQFKNVTNLPNWGGLDTYTVQLPSFNYSIEGAYILKFGMISSTGTPYGDQNSYNDLVTIPIVINDTIDVGIIDWHPSHDPDDTLYYYGSERVHSDVGNFGNKTIENLVMNFDIFNGNNFQIEQSSSCTIPTLYPGESETCVYNINTTGANKLFRFSIQSDSIGGQDVNLANNNRQSLPDINIEAGSINAFIFLSNSNGEYKSSETVVFEARTSSVASQPLNYTWREGFFLLGYGQYLNISGDELGIGSHNITLEVRDPFGTTDYTYRNMQILEAINFSDLPRFEGEIVSRESITYSFTEQLPAIGKGYLLGNGLSPLHLMILEVESVENPGIEPDIKEITLHLDMSLIAPSTVDLSTVQLRYLDSVDDEGWQPFIGDREYVVNEDGTFSVKMYSSGIILIAGELPPPSVHANNLSWSLMKNGGIELHWDSLGDIENPYFGGWNVYRYRGIEGTTYFPDPEGGINAFQWEQLTNGSLVTMLPSTSQHYVDPDVMETGICSSYALIPADRSGQSNIDMVNITRNSEGLAGLLCGDAIPPVTNIIDFRHTWRFTNSTDCFSLTKDWSRCYEVNLTWTWPQNELNGELSWNMYRIEAKPENVNLRFITPLATNLKGTPGEKGTFNQSGIEFNGIRPDRTYYYILAPIDAVGNQQFIATYPSDNVERVHIDDDWWTYNQHIIPEPEPEPEPPLGFEWLGDLEDAMETEEFQATGATMIGLIVLNFILLPLILKKRKRLKRVLDARKRNQSMYSGDFDDFFE